MRVVRRIAVVGAPAMMLVGASCSSSGSESTADSTTSSSAATLVSPDDFAARMNEPGVVTINVHVPDEGQIEGTDLVIPFDEIATSNALPEDTTTPLAVYCRSGNMSATAVADLAALGYTDIVELDGGFNAWTEAGRPLNG